MKLIALLAGVSLPLLAAACGGTGDEQTGTSAQDLNLPGCPDGGLSLPPLPTLPTGLPLPTLPTGFPTPPSLPTGFPFPTFPDAGFPLPTLPTLPSFPDAGFPQPPKFP